MTWFQADDAHNSHRKVAALETDFPFEVYMLAHGVWTKAGVDCAHRRSGEITLAQLVRLTGCPQALRVTLRNACNALVVSGLWDAIGDDTFSFHNWELYNGTAEEKKTGNAERQQRLRDRRKAKRNGVTLRVTPVTIVTESNASSPHLNLTTPQPHLGLTAGVRSAHASEAEGRISEPFEDAPQSTQIVKTSEGSGHPENTPQRGAVFDEHSVAECISTVMRTIGGVGSYDSIYVTGTHRQYVHDVVRYFRSEADHVGDTPRQLCCESVAHYLESDFVQDMKKTGRVSMTAWFKDPASNAPWSTNAKPKTLTPEEYHRANG